MLRRNFLAICAGIPFFGASIAAAKTVIKSKTVVQINDDGFHRRSARLKHFFDDPRYHCYKMYCFNADKEMCKPVSSIFSATHRDGKILVLSFEADLCEKPHRMYLINPCGEEFNLLAVGLVESNRAEKHQVTCTFDSQTAEVKCYTSPIRN